MFQERDLRREVADPCSFYQSEGMRNTAALFIPSFHEMSEDARQEALFQFFSSGRASTREFAEQVVSSGRKSMLLMLKLGMDAFQPWKRRVYSITLMGFR